MVICIEWTANDLHVVKLMLLPHHHFLLYYNPQWSTFLVLAYLDCAGTRPLKEGGERVLNMIGQFYNVPTCMQQVAETV